MKKLTFKHRFQDDREMTITAKRTGGMPKLTSSPRFTGGEPMPILIEYKIWEQEVLRTLMELLDVEELTAVAMHGYDKLVAKK